MSPTYAALANKEDLMRRWQANLETGDKEIYAGHVTGLSHHRYADFSKYIKVGTELDVRLDKNNKWDVNASGVWFKKDNGVFEQIGWVPKEFNGVVAAARRMDIPLVAIVTKHHPNNIDFQRRLFITIGPSSPKQPAVQPIVQSPEQTQMANPSKINTIITKNVDLGTSAAFLEAGRIASKQLSSIAGKKLPIMVRGYADTPIGRLILANIAMMAQEHFRPDDVKLQKLANAMAVTSYQEVLQQFDIESFIDDLLSNATIKKALKQVDLPEG